MQDAVAAANILTEPLRKRLLTVAHLHAVQERRELPTRIIQAVQLAIQNRIIAPALESAVPLKPPFVLKLLAAFPILRVIPAYAVGVGVRPEHIHSPDRTSA